MRTVCATDKGDVDDLTKEFLAESFEGLDRMDRCLTELETRPDDANLLGEIFRAVHTIKGTTGFLGFSRLERLAHAGETLLGGLRDGRLIADEELVSGLLQLMDGLRVILQLIETTGTEGVRVDDDDAELIGLMEDLDARPAPVTTDKSRALEHPQRRASSVALPVVSNERTLRIDVEVLNRMMNLVGELVLTRNQLLQSNIDASNFPELARRLDSVTADLRETVMQARMQPVGHVFSKFPRMVRDLARGCGKEVRITFSGQETGLDKSLLEAVKDPLTHAVRNAIDHGIEEAAERTRCGKPAEGRLTLGACHQNGSVVIELTDDGAGMSPSRLRAKALERNLITADQAATLSDRDALQLIFLPGFSTAEAVTNVSGRGVGMDVVRSNIERAGGTVELESHEGKGTTIRLRVPLTLAIVRALIVRSGGQSFCLPQSALIELVYLPWREADAAIERMGDAELFRLRDRLLPMVRLDRLLGLQESVAESSAKAHGFYLIVLESEGCSYGLVVDDLQAPEEIVVKPLSPVLREIGLFSGATVLGSGMLAMILDIAAVGIRAEVRKESEEIASAQPELVTLGSETTSLLIFEDRFEGQVKMERLALPLTAVERIERIALSEVEFAGGRALLQYRGELLPLEDRGGVIEHSIAVGATDLTLLIYERQGECGRTQKVGMVVGRVVDVAKGDLLPENVQMCSDRLAIVNQRLTVVRHFEAAAAELREVA
jgi:two-component system chemotaxis sensor kinase CheA